MKFDPRRELGSLRGQKLDRSELELGDITINIQAVGYKRSSKPRPKRLGRMHLVIPDCQVKPDVDISHLRWIGRYIVDKQPDVVVCIGDFADMPSLSSYDRGKKCFEGRRYKKDIEAAVNGMAQLMAPLMEYNAAQSPKNRYKPRLVMTLGNHDGDRINRAIEDDARLDGVIGISDLRYEEFGWQVYPFLEIVEIDWISYSHYFCSGVMGRPCSSAAVMLRERMGSCIAGHVQKFDLAVHPKTGHIAMMVGIAHVHDELYLTPQGNNCRRQIVVLNEVRDGRFDPMLVSLAFLQKRYDD